MATLTSGSRLFTSGWLMMLAAFGVVGCGGGGGPEGSVESETYMTEAGQAERYVGSGCVALDAPPFFGDSSFEHTLSNSGTINGETTHFAATLVYAWTDDGVRFSVKDGDGNEVAFRDFDEEFVGQTDEVSTGVTGGSVRVVHRGVDECDTTQTPAQ